MASKQNEKLNNGQILSRRETPYVNVSVLGLACLACLALFGDHTFGRLTRSKILTRPYFLCTFPSVFILGWRTFAAPDIEPLTSRAMGRIKSEQQSEERLRRQRWRPQRGVPGKRFNQEKSVQLPLLFPEEEETQGAGTKTRLRLK